MLCHSAAFDGEAEMTEQLRRGELLGPEGEESLAGAEEGTVIIILWGSSPSGSQRGAPDAALSPLMPVMERED